MEAQAADVPAHAHLWLPPDQQEEWVASKRQIPALVFGSFCAFNVLSGLALRIVNRKGQIKHPKNQALLKAGVTSLTHALLSLAAAAYAAVHRDLSHCGQQLFCHDDMASKLLTVHAGYALYEFLYWQNASAVAQPWMEMLLLNDLIVVLTAVASLLYPCRLSLVLLPYQQTLQLAALLDCFRRFAAIYGAPYSQRFKIQILFMGGYMLQAAGAAGLAAFTWWWIRYNNLWTLDLPEGASALNGVYGITLLAGTTIQAMICVKWLGGAVAMSNDIIDKAVGRGGGAGAAAKAQAAKAAAKTLAGGNKKKDKERRRK